MTEPIRETTDRRNLIAGGAGLLAGAFALPVVAQTGAAQTSPGISDYAVLTEFSPDSKPLKGGWNVRVFTDVDARKGSAINCDMATGVVTLAPGLYHLSGMSIATYFSDHEPPEMTTVRAPASAGYCRLRVYDPKVGAPSGLREIPNDGPNIISVGCPASANLSPSFVEAYYEAAQPTQIILEHQCGANPQRIYLRVFVENSKWHAMARLAIRKL